MNKPEFKKYKNKPFCIMAYQLKEPCIVHTLEGDIKGNIGDYYIIGTHEEHYVIEEDIFNSHYKLL